MTTFDFCEQYRFAKYEKK